MTHLLKGADAVFHLAAVADVRANNDEVEEINVFGSQNVFHIASKNNSKIIFASSAAVYGNGDRTWKETDECKPISPYGRSKLEAEGMLEKETDDFCILRFFNVYGPGSKSGLTLFCERIRNEEEITIFGDGNQTRDYVYIDDVISALLSALDISGTYNVATGRSVSTNSVIRMVSDAAGKEPVVRYAKADSREIRFSSADVSKVNKTGWRPRVELEEGIRKILDSADDPTNL